MKLQKISDGVYTPYDTKSGFDDKKIKPGVIFDVKEDKDRSSPQLRMLWEICDQVVSNLPERTGHATHNGAVKSFMEFTKLALGYCTRYKHNGKIHEVPSSIALGNMPPDDFNKFFNSAIEVWAGLLKCTPEELTVSI